MKTGVALLAALAITGTAGAAAATGPNVPWTRADMTAAAKAIGYPKPHAKKVACRGLGGPDSANRYAAFHCVAIYTRKPAHRGFYITGRSQGGWLCAGARLATCKLLSRGFIAKDTITASINDAADLAARGWMTNRFGSYQPTGFCQPAGALKWTCGFTTATVTLAMKTAKGGYTITAAAQQ